jgi:hypothetical protein
MRRLLAVLPLVLCLVLAPGCDSAVDVSYRGEPLLTLRGDVNSARPGLGPVEKLALRWVGANSSPARDQVALFSIETKAGSGVTRFTLPLYEPPPQDVLFRLGDGPGLAIAYLLVYDRDAVDLFDRHQVVGAAENHVVVYVDGQVQPGSQTAAFLQSTPRPGYHLMRLAHLPLVRPPCFEGEEIDDCVPLSHPLPPPQPDDEAVTIDIPARPRDVKFPRIAFP